MCKFIIHVNVNCKTPEDWRTRIASVLDTAESRKLKSVSFPALGTGIVF